MKKAIVGALALAALAAQAEEAAPPARPVTEVDASAGRAIYLRECAACHGDRGDGKGPAAKFLDPLPRNFTMGVFKFRTTPTGQPPATADVLKTIAQGVPGSRMPAFTFLSEEERRQVAAYVLRLADLLEAPEPAPIADPGSKPESTPASIERGKQLYADMGCGSCHGAKGKGDGPSAKTLVDDDGRPIPVRDFTGGVFRGGDRPVDLYYRFTVGMDGSPMPGFGDALPPEDRWALVDFVTSLREPPVVKALPKDAIKAGRAVADKYGCRGCHVLDDGKGGDVGPDLRLSGRKLGSPWVATFLAAPHDYGKVYPWRPHRMPNLGLAEEEIAVLVKYLGAMGKRAPAPAVLPDLTQFTEAAIAEGKTLYTLRCTECHNLGTVIETPAVKQQGPDLIRVAGRVDYGWAKGWILDPKKFDPKTKMTVPGLTPAQVEAVRAFVWKASMHAQKLAAQKAHDVTTR